jgi:dTDP-4-amino-4,6-dideoxygalactose transaminase
VSKGQSISEKLAIDGGTPVRSDFLAFGVPSLGEDEIDELVATVRSRWIGTGARCQEFERRFGEYVGAEHAVAVNSCTSALHLALLVAGIGPGDEVIVPAMTFGATANVVEHVGASVRFVDVDPDTHLITPEGVAEAITPRTRAVMPVHFGGLTVDLDAIYAVIKGRNIVVVEDAAHAVGSEYRGRMIGSSPDFTCFSFYPNKNMTTGEGGMLTTSDAEAAEKARILRLHGLASDAWRRYESRRLIHADVMFPGFKYNMTDLQAALGLHQLRRLPEFLQIRERHAALYDAGVRKIGGLKTQPRPTTPGERHALHLYTVLLPLARLMVDRDAVMNALLAENVGVALHYRALHTHGYYAEKYGLKPTDFPVSYEIGMSTMTLPMSANNTDADIASVLRALEKVLAAYRA